jgi:hypothetical protein
VINNATVADAILHQLVHKYLPDELKGESLRDGNIRTIVET